MVLLSAWAAFAPVGALASDLPLSFFAGAGALLQFPGRLAASPTGETSLASLWRPQITIAYRRGWEGSPWAVMPLVGLAPFSRTAPEGMVSSRAYFAGLRVIRELTGISIRGFGAHAGPGISVITSGAGGGAATLGNAGGSASFPVPDRTEAFVNAAVILGVSYSYSRFRGDVEGWINGLLSSRRAVQVIATVSVGIF